ncbi:hypothetical protein [Lewinella sp. W8]|uniref:hypothetical protein n=1 Tax=Lewinella sp. W8 TaxID=2528208 RepID=UPI001068CCC5|nr:hypothetical protein [Lewinella sp. W8]MTB52791.1 hypothetical protein [Lewinella sp. W8]
MMSLRIRLLLGGIGLLFCGTSVMAQPLHIYYNVLTQQPTYVCGGDTLDQAVVKNREEVYLHLTDLNTFRYGVEVTKTEEVPAEGTGGGLPFLQNLVPGGGLPSFGGMAGGVDPLKDISGDAGETYDEWSGEETVRGMVSAEFEGALLEFRTRFEDLLFEMDDTERKMQKLNTTLRATMAQRDKVELARREIKYLKHYPNLKPQQITTIAEEFIKNAIGNKPDDFDMLSIAEEQAKSLRTDLAKLEKLRGQYHQQTQTLNEMREELYLMGVPPGNELVQELDNSIGEVHTASLKVEENLAKNQASVETIVNTNQMAYTRSLIELRYEIEQIRSATFTYTERFAADGGAFRLNPSLYALDTAGNRTGAAAVKLTPVRVGVRGGLRISSSVGLSLGQYFSAPQDYLVREGVVVGADKDRFLPIVNTFFHFHPYSNGKASLGGALGVGLPLTGTDAAQSATFLLGPSLVLGSRDKVYLSAGLIGGRVQRLGAGLEVGDPFSNLDGVLPTTSRYELGYFFSLSFKLFGQ